VAEGDAACKQAVAAAGGLEVVVALMRAHPTDNAVQQDGCGILWSVAGGDAACKQAVAAAGGLEVVVATMREWPDDLDIQRWSMAVYYITAPPIIATLDGAETPPPLRTAASNLSSEAVTEPSHIAIVADSHQADTLGQHLLTGELRAAERALSTARCSLEGGKGQIDAVIGRLHAATTLNDELRTDLDLKDKENLRLRDLSKRRATELERAVSAERQLRAQAGHAESKLATALAELLHTQSSLLQARTELDHVRGASDGLHVQLSQTQTELALVGQARDGVREELSQLTLQLRQAQDALDAAVQREVYLVTTHDDAIQAPP
jgi:hypothetical protein